MEKSYINGTGKYQDKYNELYMTSYTTNCYVSGCELFYHASILYLEYFGRQNKNISNDYKHISLKKLWDLEFEHILDYVPSLLPTLSLIQSKIEDNELSTDMEMLYEYMMDEVLEFIIEVNKKYIREHFKIEFENISDICKDPKYGYIMRVGINKGISTGLPAMSLDELSELSNKINEFVKSSKK